MNEILSLRRKGRVPGSFVEKAITLLTYDWSRATWRSRDGILRTVDWLLRMERVRRSRLPVGTDRFAEIREGDS